MSYSGSQITPTIPPGATVLEREFAIRWNSLVVNSQPLVFQHRGIEGRKHQFDFAHLASKVAIELDGGLYGVMGKDGAKVRGGHQSISGYTKDCEKGLLAAERGWIIIRLVPSMMRGPEGIANLQTIQRIIDQRAELFFRSRQ